MIHTKVPGTFRIFASKIPKSGFILRKSGKCQLLCGFDCEAGAQDALGLDHGVGGRGR
jgi:hypothetical protein